MLAGLTLYDSSSQGAVQGMLFVLLPVLEASTARDISSYVCIMQLRLVQTKKCD